MTFKKRKISLEHPLFMVRGPYRRNSSSGIYNESAPPPPLHAELFHLLTLGHKPAFDEGAYLLIVRLELLDDLEFVNQCLSRQPVVEVNLRPSRTDESYRTHSVLHLNAVPHRQLGGSLSELP